MKPLKATEISYIIEAQIRGVSVSEVLGKVAPSSVTIEQPAKFEPVAVKPAPKEIKKD